MVFPLGTHGIVPTRTINFQLVKVCSAYNAVLLALTVYNLCHCLLLPQKSLGLFINGVLYSHHCSQMHCDWILYLELESGYYPDFIFPRISCVYKEHIACRNPISYPIYLLVFYFVFYYYLVYTSFSSLKKYST